MLYHSTVAVLEYYIEGSAKKHKLFQVVQKESGSKQMQDLPPSMPL